MDTVEGTRLCIDMVQRVGLCMDMVHGIWLWYVDMVQGVFVVVYE